VTVVIVPVLVLLLGPVAEETGLVAVVDDGVPEPGVVVVVLPFPGPPCNWPLPTRYDGIALYKLGSTKVPRPYLTPLGSVNGAGTDEPSVFLITKRVTQRRFVGSAGEENW
jgi:hypothetical protein